MLILAGISLNLVLGENGIIAKAKDAKDKSEQDIENTEIAISDLTDEMLAELGEEIPLGKVSVGEKASKNSTIDGNVGTATNPIIPEGYIPINTSTTSWGDGTSSPSAENVNKGLVITDSVDETTGKSNGNEWVWVPVTNASVMYSTEGTPIELTGGSGKTYLSGVNVSKYSKSINIINNDSSTVTISRVLPNNTSSFREPDVVVGSGSSYDAVDTNRATAGFIKANGTTMTLAEMANTMKSEYDTMIASIEKYHGFYIGRYELTANGEKAGAALTGKTWYELYANCKSLAASDKAITRMIWGCQWDVTCNWIANYGDKKDINDSSSWGNYSNSTAPANTGNYEQSVKKDTGSNEAWKANNIYDFAGNCFEWTQEAGSTDDRAGRGGLYGGSGSGFPAFCRGGSDPTRGSSSRRFSLHFNSATLRTRA